jgi:hypothetical protein
MVRTNERSQGVKSQVLKRRRNSWLEKMLDKAPRGKAGGVRESLTKKLYAGGVSRKTWDRDWDISFWKEQSSRIKKAKQEASHVVEGRASVRAGEFPRDGIVVKEEAGLEKYKNIDAEGDSILSRLYVADTSLFPRNNDIKPLYLLGDVKEEGKTKCPGGEKGMLFDTFGIFIRLHDSSHTGWRKCVPLRGGLLVSNISFEVSTLPSPFCSGICCTDRC